MFLLLLCGCGKTEYSIEEANGRTVITVDCGKIPMFERCISKFNQTNRDYYVLNMDYSGTNFEESVDAKALRMMTGRSTDVVYLAYDYRLPQYIAKGALEDLTPYIKRDIKKKDYLDGTFELFSADMGTYAVPVIMQINMLWKKCENNSPYETISFSELCDLVEQKKPLSLFHLPTLDTLWYIYLFFPFDVESTEELTRAIEMAKQYQRSEEKGVEFERNFLLLNTITSDPELLVNLYYSFGKLGVGCSGVNEPVITGWPFGISSSSDEKEGAWEFIRFLLQEEGQDILGKDFAPVHKSNFKSMCERFYDDEINKKDCEKTGATKEEFLQRYNEMLQKGRPEELMTDTYDIWRILEEEAQMYYSGDRSMEATVEMIQNRVGLYREENEK